MKKTIGMDPFPLVKPAPMKHTRCPKLCNCRSTFMVFQYIATGSILRNNDDGTIVEAMDRIIGGHGLSVKTFR